jgi:hypothetical protein
MFLGYAGSPVLKFRSCDDQSCQQNSSKRIKIAYYFPKWFLDRMVALTCDWGPLDGHRITIRTQRLITPDADVFAFAERGNLEGLKALFTRGEASPFDVDAINGRLALNLATMEEKPMVCKFLLQAGANPEETDKVNRSSIDMVWNLMVREGRKNPNVQALVQIFNLQMDDAYDYLLTRKVTPLH